MRVCFEIGYDFSKNLKYWNSWNRFLKKQKAMIQNNRKYNINLSA